MKKRINTCAFTVIALLFSTLTLSTVAVAAPSSPSVAEDEQIAQVLDLLGVRALIEQVPAVLVAAIDAEAKFQPPTTPAANWRRDLEKQLKPQQVLQDVSRYLREHYRADTFAQAQQRLQEPLAKRVRYFDFAMTQAGAEKNLREFVASHKAERSDGAADERNIEARRALLKEIDTATSSSLLTAMLQSAVAVRVQQVAGGGAVDPLLLNDAIAERQRYLEPLAVDYLFYDYRYLRDDELSAYRDLMRDEAVQWLLDISRQALLTTIAGTLTSSPLTQQPLTPPPNRTQ